MTERDAFLKAILADPDEDSHRLVFADWLTENGDADRGEFIRVQCELARRWPLAPPGTAYYDFPPGKRRGCPEYQRLLARARELWEHVPRGRTCTSGYTWTLPLGDLFGEHLSSVQEWFCIGNFSESVRWTCRRGFVESVTCRGDDWVRHGDAVLAEHPVREVVLTEPAGFAARPEYGGFRLDADTEKRVAATTAVQAECYRRVARAGESRGETVSLAILGVVWPGVTFRRAGDAG
jgi:uncharacterized protein (TIGR02996 family)